MSQSAATPARKAPGMERPTSSAERTPSAQTTTIITSTMAAMTLACRSESMSLTCSDSSWRRSTRTLAGQVSRLSAMTAFTASTVSMMLAPARFLTSRASAGWPSMRAKEVGSS